MTDRIGQLRALLAPLWALPEGTYRTLHDDPALAALVHRLADLYTSAKATFGLRRGVEDALVKLGIPCLTPQDAGDLDEAAKALDASLAATQVTRRYFVPLDLADDLPPLRFGPAQLRFFSKLELAELLDATRLVRFNRGGLLDLHRLIQVQWLIVEDRADLHDTVSERTFPFLRSLGDLGATMPHQSRYSEPVTAALFALLLFPWEDWVSAHAGDWRAFSIPYVHVGCDDLFDGSRGLPTSEDFAFEPRFAPDGEEEGERPIQIHLNMDDGPSLETLEDGSWADLERALATELFATPIQHFFVQAFFNSGMDEIMAHMTAIEAALGMQADFQQRSGKSRMTVKKRLAARVGAITGEPDLGDDYEMLFELRSTFVHGRAMTDKVPGDIRLKARRVARRVVVALIKAALDAATPLSRQDYLDSLA